MSNAYIVERLYSSDEDGTDTYAVLLVENNKARTVCVGISSEQEATKISNALIWYESFTSGYISIPDSIIKTKLEKRKVNKRNKKP